MTRRVLPTAGPEQAKMFVLQAASGIPELGIEATDLIILTPDEGDVTVQYHLPATTMALITRALALGELTALANPGDPAPSVDELRTAMGLDLPRRRPRPRLGGGLALVRTADQPARRVRRRPPDGDAA